MLRLHPSDSDTVGSAVLPAEDAVPSTPVGCGRLTFARDAGFYPRLAVIVEAACAEFGVRYTAHESCLSAFASHWRWLRRLGRPPPAESATRAGEPYR